MKMKYKFHERNTNSIYIPLRETKGVYRNVKIRKTCLFCRGHNDMGSVLQDGISLSSHTLQWQFEEAPCLHS